MDSAAARSVGIVLETFLLQTVLAPLGGGDDNALGSYGTACIAQSIARSDAHGFGALVAASLERRHD